jgi:hypothetical protein
MSTPFTEKNFLQVLNRCFLFNHRPRPLVRHSCVYLFLGLGLLFSMAVFHAPAFLLISQAPARSDAVVFFPGGEKGARVKEAERLLSEGFADYLSTQVVGIQIPSPALKFSLSLTVISSKKLNLDICERVSTHVCQLAKP